MDQFDRAQEVERMIRAEAIAKAQGTRSASPSRTTCLECGDAIPQPRREAVPGCTLCFTCQNEQEKRS